MEVSAWTMGDYESCLLQALQRAQRERLQTSIPPAYGASPQVTSTGDTIVSFKGSSPVVSLKNTAGQNTLESYNTGVSYGSSPEENVYPLGGTDVTRNSSTSSGGSHHGHHGHGSGGNSADEHDLGPMSSASDHWEVMTLSNRSSGLGPTPMDIHRFRNESTSSDERDPFRSGNYNISPDSLGSNISPIMEPGIPEHIMSTPASSSAPGSLLRGSGGGYVPGSGALTPKATYNRDSGSSASGDEAEFYGTQLSKRQHSFTNLRQPQRDTGRGLPGGYRHEFGSGPRPVGTRSFSEVFRPTHSLISPSQGYRSGGSDFGSPGSRGGLAPVGSDFTPDGFTDISDMKNLPQPVPPMEKWCKYRVEGSWCTQKRCRFYPCNTENRSHWPNRCWRCRRSNCPGGC